jgi:hypothetical protein
MTAVFDDPGKLRLVPSVDPMVGYVERPGERSGGSTEKLAPDDQIQQLR